MVVSISFLQPMVVILSFDIVFTRVKESTDIKNMTQLAEFLEISQQYVSKKKRENIFPSKWATSISIEYDLSIDWILFGKSKGAEQKDILKDINEWYEEKIEGDEKEEYWFEKQFSECFPAFSRWRNKSGLQSNTVPKRKIA